MKEIERMIEDTRKRVVENNKNSEGGQYALDIEDEVAKAIEQYVEDCKSVAYTHGLLSNEAHQQDVIKARIEECQDWLDYFKAQDADQRIYLLENHFEKHITELKKGLKND